MGAAISEMKSQIERADDAKGKEQEIKEALENMRLMAADQLEAFNLKIRNRDADTHLIPISKILSSFEYIQCTSSSANTIGPGIKDAVKDFSTGPVADGIANLASSVIGKLLGESSGSRQLQTRYIISIDPLGGISRLDALFFVYNFSSEGLMKTAKSVVATCVVKSSADVREVDDNTLRVLVNQCFETSPLDLRKAIYGELCDALYNSKDPAYKASLQAAKESQRAALASFAQPKVIAHSPEKEQNAEAGE
ncbi:hypothetical protein RSOLAG1IB_06141 [Rhizoctonia solani AG-1 IB]|uniref:Uncharacterized protein n=1 Tax=Thanatephorus cucumeris (strain AG1-IB / isolate 7/3/14) TaxID=1108050 RepID=M5BQK4_THACB|nr:hypothetical protein BN14_02713 [Rhizoctonia solani AG-1 IB]CEL53073.1 hypothetical protein RSOLAG1IB_06141 [Rhizoctonia solani AG-1 IB]